MITALCASCLHPILWCRTDTGKKIPLNPNPVPEGNLVLLPGTPLPTARSITRVPPTPGEALYVSHVATCRHATTHRTQQP